MFSVDLNCQMKSLSSTNAQHHFCFQLLVQAMQAAANAAASTASGVAAGAAAGAAAAAAQAGMYETVHSRISAAKLRLKLPCKLFQIQHRACGNCCRSSSISGDCW